jgi:hypothetical protein
MYSFAQNAEKERFPTQAGPHGILYLFSWLVDTGDLCNLGILRSALELKAMPDHSVLYVEPRPDREI